MTFPLSQVAFVLKLSQSLFIQPLEAEGRGDNPLSPPFPAGDVFQTSGRPERENCSIRQVIWFSVLKGCEFLDHQSYLHSNISIQTHQSPNIVQPLYDVGAGRQDLCRPYGHFVSAIKLLVS